MLTKNTDASRESRLLPPGDLPGGKEPSGNEPTGSFHQNSFDVEIVYEAKKKKRRDTMVQAALENNHSLSQAVQDKLLKTHLAEGWGRFAHGITRQMKSPGRYGLKLVDVALIMTIYDHTIALVNPVAFAPISAEDFRTETGMDESNIRIALNALLNRGAILKIKTGLINFWALNPHYFSLKQQGKDRGELPPGKQPRGNAPEGSAPGVAQGNLPGESGGQTTRGQSDQTNENQKGISVSKNLSKESKKESSFGNSDFPEDMTARWLSFEKSGYEQKAKSEREIFEELFLKHGKSFFENCGKVIEFLEVQGTGKDGDEGKIHSPMVWIRNHWELNLNRYQNWIKRDQALDEAHAERLEKEAKLKAEEAERERIKVLQAQEEAQWQAQMSAHVERFLSVYSSDAEFIAFVEEAIQLDGNSFIKTSWRKSGWNSELVRSCVISHFLKVESGEHVTQIPTKVSEEIA